MVKKVPVSFIYEAKLLARKLLADVYVVAWNKGGYGVLSSVTHTFALPKFTVAAIVSANGQVKYREPYEETQLS